MRGKTYLSGKKSRGGDDRNAQNISLIRCAKGNIHNKKNTAGPDAHKLYLKNPNLVPETLL